jgi:AcrR family transcriptional regulator
MPAKKCVTAEMILQSAIEFVRQKGEANLSAPALASFIGCSTQPLYAAFENIATLKKAVKERALAVYLDAMQAELTSKKYPAYKAFGMGYIHFARDERELFRLLFLCNRNGDFTVNDPTFSKAVQTVQTTLGLQREQAEQFQLEMWAYVHGIATMLATGYLTLSEEMISQMLTDVYGGLKQTYIK